LALVGIPHPALSQWNAVVGDCQRYNAICTNTKGKKNKNRLANSQPVFLLLNFYF
jgi:hypothetical protein